jgi:PAS domain S-box-containing protein
VKQRSVSMGNAEFNAPTLRRTLLLLLFSVSVTAGLVYYNYRTEVSATQSILRRNEESLLNLARQRTGVELAAAISDVAYFTQETNLQRWLANGDGDARRSLAQEYLASVRQKGVYDQLRFIDERGREVARVDRNSGSPRIVPDAELQDKSGRYYVSETLSLDPGQVYVSPFDLNVERGVIEQPIKPMIRIGMPVFDNAGRKRGAIVANYLGERLLDAMREFSSRPDGGLWLLNSDGYWLKGPRREDEWAFMYPDRRDRTFTREFPAAWESIGKTPGSGQFVSNGDLFTFTTVTLPQRSQGVTESTEKKEGAARLDLVSPESWILLSRVSASALAAQMRPLALRAAAIFGVIALLEVLVAWFVFRHWSARTTAELAAVRSEANFNALLDAAPDAILVTDYAGKVRLVNGRAERLFGYERERLVGQLVEDLIPKRFRERHAQFRTDYVGAPGLRNMGGGAQLWALRSDGTEVPVDIRLSPVATDGEGLVFASARDVTERYHSEQTIQDLARRLEHDNMALNSANAELDAFCYSVSHDLRAPLRSMAGFCQALVEDYGDKLDETGADYVKRVSAAATRMGRLIDDLLTLSRVTRTEIKLADVDFSSMAETIAGQLHQDEPDRQVEFKIQPGVMAQGDEILLRTVLENLLGNAWKYSSKKPHATIEFGTSANGSETTYFVRDNGAGFDMAHADKLFKPFQRLHGVTEFEGTGIGLASVANIVRRHGGRIWAEAKPDLGATMLFTLPS